MLPPYPHISPAMQTNPLDTVAIHNVHLEIFQGSEHAPRLGGGM